MKSFFFTFQIRQNVLRNKYVEIRKNNEWDAREEMNKNFGCQWAFSYDEEIFKEIKEKWNLTRYAVIMPEGRVEYD